MRLGPADAVSADELHAVLVGQPSVTEPNMPRIAPGEPANSFLLRKLRGDFAGLGCSPADCGRPMPFGAPPLPEQTIEMLERWITDGAPM